MPFEFNAQHATRRSISSNSAVIFLYADSLKRSIQREGHGRRLKAFEQERFKFGGGPAKLSKEVKVPSKLTTVALDGLIRELIEIKSQVGLYPENEVSFVIDKG